MKPVMWMAVAFFLASALVCAASPPVVIQELLATDHTAVDKPISLPADPQLRVSIYTIAPGALLPVHLHPFQRYAYVLSGALDVTLVEHEKTIHYNAGDFIVEAVGEWHYGMNHGKIPVKLLVIDQMPKGEASNTVLRDEVR